MWDAMFATLVPTASNPRHPRPAPTPKPKPKPYKRITPAKRRGCMAFGHVRGAHDRCVQCREAAARLRFALQTPCVRGHEDRDEAGNCKTCAVTRATAFNKLKREQQ